MSVFTTSQNTQIQTWITENRADENFVETLIEWVNKNTKNKKVKASKKDVDPNRVKRPVPASWMYREENRVEIIRDHFEGEDVKGSLVAKKAQELWNGLSEDEKRPYEDKRKVLWVEYKKTQENVPKVEKVPKEEFTFKVPEDSEVPEGWVGPYEGKYLHKYVEGLGKEVGRGLFSTLSEAMEAASGNDNCKGITLCKFGYTLREGGVAKFNPKYEATSWIKSEFDSEKKKSKKNKSEKKKSEKKESSKKETIDTEVEESGENETTDEEVEESGEKETIDTEVEESGEKETTDEEVEESGEKDTGDDFVDSDDEYEAEVVEWTYEGDDYLLDEDTNVVYSVESQQQIGKRTKKSGSWKIKYD